MNSLQSDGLGFRGSLTESVSRRRSDHLATMNMTSMRRGSSWPGLDERADPQGGYVLVIGSPDYRAAAEDGSPQRNAVALSRK